MVDLSFPRKLLTSYVLCKDYPKNYLSKKISIEMELVISRWG